MQKNLDLKGLTRTKVENLALMPITVWLHSALKSGMFVLVECVMSDRMLVQIVLTGSK